MFEKQFVHNIKNQPMKKSALIFLLFLLGSTQLFSQNMDEKNGPWRSTYPDGSVKSTGQFDHNIPYGEFIHYYKSGIKQSVTVFENQGIQARNSTWYESGNLMAEGKYINKQKDSTWSYYGDSIDQLIAVEQYSMGKLEGRSITYYPGTTQAAEVILYHNGIKQGDLRKYFPDGQVMTEGTYLNGKLEGFFTLYYPDGSTQLRGGYKNGEQSGEWKYYSLTGKEITYEEFSYQQSTSIEADDPDKSGEKIQPF
jgi:antitoxin component YwqK of YwqJK toxin-antitoxin module